MMIDQHTKLYGVLGHPIGHSLSPTMQNKAFSTKALNAVYLAFETRDVGACLEGMKSLGIRGMSVTLPYKSTVIPFLDEVDELAKRIGAVNTIANDHGRMIGYNTDGLGAILALEEKIELSSKSCLLIGAGGAARAIGFALKERGVTIVVANRSESRREELSLALQCRSIHIDEIVECSTDMLIQTTPVGMHPFPERSVVPDDALRKGAVVMDIIYNPLETKLLTAARKKGCLTIDGLAMFVHQGAEQFRIWTGLEPPLEAMTRAVKEALKVQIP